MRACAALSAAVVAVSLLLGPVSPVHAGAWSLAPGEYFTAFVGGWSSSDFYHDQDGGKLPLASGGLWEERSLTSRTELAFMAPRWLRWLIFGVPAFLGPSKSPVHLVLELPAKSVTRELGASALGRTLPTTTGLGDALVGFRLPIASERVGAAIELDWKLPLGYERDRFLTHADSVSAGDIDGNGDSLDFNRARQLGSPVLGDGQTDFTLALHLGTALMNSAFVQVSAGYKYRLENPQDQIVAGVDLGLWVTRSLLLAGRYQGEIAVQESDAPTSDPDRHRAGPTLVYRVDDRMDLVLSTMHTAAATNALHTDEVYVGVAFRQTKLNRLQGFLGGGASP